MGVGDIDKLHLIFFSNALFIHYLVIAFIITEGENKHFHNMRE